MAKGKFAFGAFVGVAAGFVAGILTAKKSGKETREELKNIALDKKDDAIAKAFEVKHKAGDVAEDVVEKAEKVAADVADKVIDTTKGLKSKSQQAAKDAKTTIQNNK